MAILTPPPQTMPAEAGADHAVCVAAHENGAIQLYAWRDADGEAWGAGRALQPIRRWAASASAARNFNAVVSVPGYRVYVMLESGLVLAPGCIARLVGALAADPCRGLAGPSTNQAWNEQQQFPLCGASHADIAATGARAAELYGEDCVSLAPLHSLGDFCYAIRRETVDAVGAADEAYGAGPCWEMDYNIRAARAGFSGVWVKGAFAWRAPLHARQSAPRADLLDINKQLYQRRFCALQLTGAAVSYDAHCSGDDCPHFAPRPLITIHRPLAPPPTSIERALPVDSMVSCIMPTADRRALVPAAISSFLTQDYGPRELIIIDDGDDAIENLVPRDPRIRYMRLAQRQTLGEKRNLACELARGQIIVHWDDDDWHAPDRLSYQVADLVSSGRQLAGAEALLFHDPVTGRAWRYRYSHAHLRWVAGGTLCYWRSYWQSHRFAPVNDGEDTRFVFAASTADIHAHGRHDFYVARIHAANTSRKQIVPPFWREVAAGEVTGLIRRWSLACPPRKVPAVSCVMPTNNRPTWALQAVRYFLDQDHGDAELVIADDGTPGLQPLLPADSRLRYVRMPRAATIGAKRQAACALTDAAVIVLWDDDDWHGPTRLSRQVEPLTAGRADITALRDCRFYELHADRWWRCSADLHRRLFAYDVIGGTLAFRREVFQRIGFRNMSVAEDADLLRRSVAAGYRLEAVEALSDYVYVRHSVNTWSFTLGRVAEGWLPATENPGHAAHRDFYERQAGRRGQCLTAAADRSPDHQSEKGSGEWLGNVSP